MEGKKIYIKNFYDLNVYQRLFKLSKVVIIKVIPKLPPEEKYDLIDQARRACKAGPAILAEGFPKRFQVKHWQKYIIDAIGECTEMIHHLSCIKEFYPKYVNSKSVQCLIDEYEIAVKQLYALNKSWKDYHKNKETP